MTSTLPLQRMESVGKPLTFGRGGCRGPRKHIWEKSATATKQISPTNGLLGLGKEEKSVCFFLFPQDKCGRRG